MNRTTTYQGAERRSNTERRAVAPREVKGAPRLHSAIQVPGHPAPFGPGQEHAFAQAVEAYNKTDEGKAAPIDLQEHAARGNISGFDKVTGEARTAMPGTSATVNTQLGAKGADEVRDQQTEAGSGPASGGPLASQVEAKAGGGVAARSGRQRSTRTGGAGQTRARGGNARGERSRAERAAADK